MRWLGRWLLELTVVGGAATAIAAALLEIWDRSLSIPFYRGSDVQFISEIVKTIDQHGWYLHNPDVGAPFGQQLYDFPHAGETLQLVAVRALGLFTDRFGVIVNAYYLLGFGFLAVVTYIVLRHLRFARIIAGAVALLYTFLPYHLSHQEQHLFRSTYYSAPLAALLILWVLSFRATFLRSVEGPMWPWRALKDNLRWRQVAVAILVCAVIALTETMTIAFTLTALATTCLLIAARDRSVAQLVAGGIAVAIIGIVFAFALLPNLLYWQQHGSNPKAGHRTIAEQEYYGLRISQMVLPSAQHRLKAASDITARTNEASPIATDEGGQALGLLGTLGLAALVGVVLVRGVPRNSRTPVHDRSQLLRHGGLISLVLVLFGTVSGLAITLDLLGFTQIRVWNRVVVLIAFFALIAVAIGLERAGARLARVRHGRVLSAIGLLLVFGFGLWDTTGQVPPVTEYRRVDNVRAFDAALEQRLPAGASLFQVPVVPFPENPTVVAMKDYDEFLPYLWSNDLRWSYGAMRGRPEGDWQQKVDSDNPVPSLAGLRGLGFDGIVADSAGYADFSAALTKKLTAALGPPDVMSPGNGRWKFWDLRKYASEQGKSAAQLRAAARKLVGPLVDELPTTH